MYQELLEEKATFGNSMEKSHYKTLHACPLQSRENFLQEQKLNLSKLRLDSPSVQKPEDKNPRRAPKRKLESEDESPVRRPGEDSPSSSSQKR